MARAHQREYSGQFFLRPIAPDTHHAAHARSGSAPASLIRYSRRTRPRERERLAWDRPSPSASIPGIPEGIIDGSLETEVTVEDTSHTTHGRKGRGRSASLIAVATFAAATIGCLAINMRDLADISYDVPEASPKFPMLPGSDDKEPSPATWKVAIEGLQPNEIEAGKDAVDDDNRPKAAITVLVTEDDAASTIQTVSSLDQQFNNQYQYDWVFFSPRGLSDSFRGTVSNATKSDCIFEQISREVWSVPVDLDASRVRAVFDGFEQQGMNRNWMMELHHGARWKAGLFAEEKRLDNYDWFWMVEPGTTFGQPVGRDIFRFMRDNDLSYGTESEKVYSLHANKAMWNRVRTFVKTFPEMIHPRSMVNYLLKVVETGHDDLEVLTEEHYDFGQLCKASLDADILPPRSTVHLATDAVPDPGCHDCPSFVMGSVQAFRSQPFRRFIRYLDRSGLFYYHTISGDLVHRLAVTMFRHPQSSWFFNNIGASPGYCAVCPLELVSDTAGEEETVYDFDGDAEEPEPHGNESFGSHQFEQMWMEIEARLSGLEVSKLESGQTFNIFRVAEQEGLRIDIAEEKEEPILTLPDSPMEREIDFVHDLWTEQFIRGLQGGH